MNRYLYTWSDLRVRTELLDWLDRQHAPVTRSVIQRATCVPADRLRVALAALAETGEVTVVTRTGGNGRPCEYYATGAAEIQEVAP